jgi:hypothetical protein
VKTRYAAVVLLIVYIASITPRGKATEGRCEERCGWWAAFGDTGISSERTAWSSSEVRRQARAHTAETGHTTTIVVSNETTYEATGDGDQR